jgi:phosphate:Na+ symporter
VLFRFYAWVVPLTAASLVHQVANAHLLIKLVTVVLFLPAAPALAWLVTKVLPGEDRLNAAPEFLDYDAVKTPRRALENAVNEIRRMFGMCIEMLGQAVESLIEGDEAAQALVIKREALVDDLEKIIAEYIVRIGQERLPPGLSTRPALLLHVMSDVERIGDHAENIVELRDMCRERGVEFSPEAAAESRQLVRETAALGGIAARALETQDEGLMAEILSAKQRHNALVDTLLDNHAARLEAGTCTVVGGIVFVETVISMRRVSNHLRNIVMSITSRVPEHTRQVAKLRQELADDP